MLGVLVEYFFMNPSRFSSILAHFRTHIRLSPPVIVQGVSMMMIEKVAVAEKYPAHLLKKPITSLSRVKKLTVILTVIPTNENTCPRTRANNDFDSHRLRGRMRAIRAAGFLRKIPWKKEGRRFVACAPGTSPVLIRLCSGEHDRCTCRGQRQPAAYHAHRHAVGKGKHTHNKDGRGMLMFHDCCPLSLLVYKKKDLRGDTPAPPAGGFAPCTPIPNKVS